MAVQGSATTKWVTHYRTFLLFGDSLTGRSFDGWGWGAKLAHAYVRRVDVLNRGFGGYNTRWAKLLLPTIFPPPSAGSHGPSLVVIFFGANDAALAHNELQHVPLQEYEDNLNTIVAHVKRTYQHSKVIVITPPPVHEEQMLADQVARYQENATRRVDRTNTNTHKYADAAERVASRHGVPTVNLWKVMMEKARSVQGGHGAFFIDGLHFSSFGNQVVFEELQGAIQEHFPELVPEELPAVFPWWNEVDGKDLQASFTPPSTRPIVMKAPKPAAAVAAAAPAGPRKIGGPAVRPVPKVTHTNNVPAANRRTSSNSNNRSPNSRSSSPVIQPQQRTAATGGVGPTASPSPAAPIIIRPPEKPAAPIPIVPAATPAAPEPASITSAAQWDEPLGVPQHYQPPPAYQPPSINKSNVTSTSMDDDAHSQFGHAPAPLHIADSHPPSSPPSIVLRETVIRPTEPTPSPASTFHSERSLVTTTSSLNDEPDIAPAERATPPPAPAAFEPPAPVIAPPAEEIRPPSPAIVPVAEPRAAPAPQHPPAARESHAPALHSRPAANSRPSNAHTAATQQARPHVTPAGPIKRPSEAKGAAPSISPASKPAPKAAPAGPIRPVGAPPKPAAHVPVPAARPHSAGHHSHAASGGGHPTAVDVSKCSAYADFLKRLSQQ